MGIKLSIIIPCFNDGKYIMEAVSSAEACLGREMLEIIIVNDGSNDKFTCQKLDQLKLKGYCVLDQDNRGTAAARNLSSAGSRLALTLGIPDTKTPS